MKIASETLKEDDPKADRSATEVLEADLHRKAGHKAQEAAVDFTSMATLAPPLSSKRPDKNHAGEPNHFEVLEQLDRITASPHFRNSKRYPNLLRFVVEHTLAGKTDLLKERTLGIEVFGRHNEYDTNADPVVRVAAGEIRKRIAQYYQTDGHEHQLRIDLPVGSYVPQFLRPASAPNPTVQAMVAHATAGSHPVEHGGPPAYSVIANEDSTSEAAFPELHPPPVAPSSTHDPARILKRPASAFFFSALSLLLLALLALGGTLGLRQWRNRQSEKGIEYFWKPILAADTPALIVIGVHSLDATGKDLSPEAHVSTPLERQQSMLSSMIRFDMVPVSDIVSYSQLTRLLTERGHPYRTQGSSYTTFEELQRSPVILVGGFDNVWTLRLTSTLRYRFENPGSLVGTIVDIKQPDARWSFDNGQSAVGDSRDYAIVASFFDPRIQQRVLIAAGIGKSGTAAAAQFLTTSTDLESWFTQAKPAKNKNVELVLSTEIVDGQAGPPQVIAGYSW